MNNKILVFDVGGSSIKYSCNQLKLIKIFYIKNISKKDVIDFISNLANKHQANEICLSLPGIVNCKTGYITGLSAIKNWNNINVIKELLLKLKNKKTKIWLDNDANCALLGNIIKYKKTIISALSIVIGTGIGGSYYADKKIQRGFTNSMGEFGVMFYIGNKNKTISQELSTNGLCVKVNKILKTNYNGLEVFNLFINQDSRIYKIVENWIKENAIFIYNMIWAFDPQVVFVGGAISKNKIFQKVLLSEIDLLFKEINFKRKTKLIFSPQGNKINLLGALSLSPYFN